MKSRIVLTVAAFVVAAAGYGSYAYYRYFPRDGSTLDKAIIVPSGLGDQEVSWEMAEAHRLYPDANLGDATQWLVPYKGRLLDAYEFHTSEREADRRNLRYRSR